MKRNDFERKYGEIGYATMIFVPHAGAKFRKLKISHRLLVSVFSLIFSSFLLSAIFSVTYFRILREQAPVQSQSVRVLERQLADANAQMARSLRELDMLTQHMVREQRSREQLLVDTQRRYESLRALTEGQEKIAEAHRAILERRTLTERLVEIGLGFSIGVLSSLVASVLILWFRSKPGTASEAEATDSE